MTEHPSTQVLEEYARRVLAPDVFLAVHRHVSTCPDCLRGAGGVRKEDYSNLLSAVTPPPEEEAFHLSAAELSGYVNDDLEELDREDVESHLEVCDQCRSEVEKLRSNIADRPAIPLWRVYVQWPPVQIAALVLLTLILAGFALWYARNRSRPLQAPLQNGSKPQESHASASPSPVQTPDEPVGIVAQLNDGGKRIVLNEKGQLEGVEHLPPSVQRTIKSTLTSQTLEKPDDLEELIEKPGVLLGERVEGEPFELLGPIATVLQDNQPVFRWRPLEGATGYIVSVLDARLDEVATSDTLAGTEWQVPKKLNGGIYSWQVTAIKDGQRIVSPTLPAPQAKFKILDARKAAEISRAKRDFPESHLALGVMFTRAGLLDDAAREFELLQRANPGSSLAKKLLDQVRAMQKPK